MNSDGGDNNVGKLIGVIKRKLGKCKKGTSGILLSIGERRKLETQLNNLLAERLQLKVSGGGGVNATTGSGVKELRSKRVKWQDVSSAFKGRIRTGSVVNLKHTKLSEFFVDVGVVVRLYLRKAIRINRCIKVNFVFCGDFVKPNNPDVIDRKYFNTRNFEILESSDIYRVIELGVEEINTKLTDFNEGRSGSALKTIISFAVNINTFCAIIG